MSSSQLTIPATTAPISCFRFNKLAKCPRTLSRNCNVDGATSLRRKASSGSISNAVFVSGTGGRGRRRRGFECKAQLAELAPAASAAYGLLLFSGGLFAYQKSGSKGSLFGGLTGAALMGAAFFLMQVPDTKDIGDALGFGSAFLFCCIFGIRLAATRKLTPAGPLFGVSVSALLVFISAYLQHRL